MIDVTIHKSTPFPPVGSRSVFLFWEVCYLTIFLPSTFYNYLFGSILHPLWNNIFQLSHPIGSEQTKCLSKDEQHSLTTHPWTLSRLYRGFVTLCGHSICVCFDSFPLCLTQYNGSRLDGARQWLLGRLAGLPQVHGEEGLGSLLCPVQILRCRHGRPSAEPPQTQAHLCRTGQCTRRGQCGE